MVAKIGVDTAENGRPASDLAPPTRRVKSAAMANVLTLRGAELQVPLRHLLEEVFVARSRLLVLRRHHAHAFTNLRFGSSTQVATALLRNSSLARDCQLVVWPVFGEQNADVQRS